MHMNNAMNGEYKNAMAHQQNAMIMQQQGWQRAHEEKANEERQMQHQFEQMRLQNEGENWANELSMENGFAEAKVSKEEEQRNIANSSSSMLNVMMSDPDPRFQNSQFLHFLKRIEGGEIVIEGKEIKEVKPDTITMENAWNEAELIQQSN